MGCCRRLPQSAAAQKWRLGGDGSLLRRSSSSPAVQLPTWGLMMHALCHNVTPRRHPLQGYYVDLSGACAQCTLPGCSKCASPNGDAYCEQCQKGYYVPTDAAGTCASCTIANCLQCTGASTDAAPTCAQVGAMGWSGLASVLA